jgi:hypothetical protein
MSRGLPIYRSLPDPWRGWIGLRRARRWLQAVALARRHNRRQPADAPTVNFYPMRPSPNSAMAQIVARLPVRIGHSPRGGALTFAWDTGTHFRASRARLLPADAVNGRCLDISKARVDSTWAQVAGYSISLDPLTTHGPMVEKPDENGRHGGRVVHGPLQRRAPGMVYQRLVDSRTADGRILQLRVVVMYGRIVFTYGKWRPYPNWFTGTELTLPRPADEFLSQDEQVLILRFAEAMGLEYGELDTLRDQDGRIYVVDANRTPVRPKGLPPDQEQAAFETQARAFAERLAS